MSSLLEAFLPARAQVNEVGGSAVPAITVRSESRLLALIAGAVLLIYCVAAALFVQQARPNADEGFYLVSAHATSIGLMPYRDFTYTQTPFLPYWHGLILEWIGFGVRELRSLNAVWGAGSLLLVLVLLFRSKASLGITLLAAMAWMSSPAAFYFTIIAKSYAFAGFALLLGGAALAFEGRPWIRFAWLAVWASMAVGSRLTVAPAVLLLWLGLIARMNWRPSWIAALGWPLFCAALIFGPFLIAAPESMVFWIWGLHAEHASFVANKNALGALWQSLLFVPAVVGVVVAALFAQRRLDLREPGLWWLTAGMAGWISNVGASGVYGEYATPFWPLAIAGAGGLLSRQVLGRRRFIITVLSLAALAMIGFSKSSVGPYESWLQSGYLAAINQSASRVAANSTPDDVIISSMPEVTLAAGRQTLPELVAGKFGVTAEMSPARARTLRLLTFEQLIDTVALREAAVVILASGQRWSFGWSIPSLRPLAPISYARFTDPLEANYVLAHEDQFFRVWVRKPAEPSLASRNPFEGEK